MTTQSGARTTQRLELLPTMAAEVVRWSSPAGDGECTVTWLPTDQLDTGVMSTEVTAVELRRAAGYSRANDRLLSLGSAWLMRRLVAISLDVAPLEAPVERRCARCAGSHGRPVIRAATRDGATVHVSATHSGGLVGVALSTSAAVGLDVEDLRARGPNTWPAVWRALGRANAVVGPASEPEAVRDAATAWVRTEALLKATGQGLAVSPRSVDISPGREPAVKRWPWGDPTGRVSLFDLNPGPRYTAALAVILDRHTDFASRPTR